MDFDFSKVEKPSRYLGGESGSVKKDPDQVASRICLAFPDIYEIGMSHLGHQVVYALFNQRPEIYAERVYMLWDDARQLHRQAGYALKSLETHTPLREFDVIGFTIAYELCATNVLAMLDLGDIPMLSKNRNDDDPIVIAGGPCTSNPEPMSDFIDAFLIGEAEPIINELSDALIASKGQPRQARLKRIAEVPGMYVPALFEVTYGDDGTIAQWKGPEKKARRQILPDMDSVLLPVNPIAPNAKAVHERLTVEVARGCSRGCRFCQAGMLYRPVRERNGKTLAGIIDEGLANSGFGDVSLLSLSTGDYTNIVPLLTALIQSKSCERISVSLPSLRVESLQGEMMDQIAKIKRTGFTLAPEAGSDKLRAVLNKGMTREEILEAIRTIFSKGWDLVKLYFMIGLPGETLADVDAIIDLVHEAHYVGRRENKRARINVNVATFVPKPHTPFQWAPQLSLQEAKRRINHIKSKLMRRNINLKWQDPRMSVVEGAITRGNRETGKAILAAYKSGALFDAWTDHFSLDLWEKAFEEIGNDLYREAGWVPPKTGTLPWEIIDPAISKEFLLDELERATLSKFTEDCRTGACLDCGACGDEIEIKTAEPETAENLFQMPKNKTSADAAFRYRLRYMKTERSRFLGHLELSSAFLRAFKRAQLPLAYTGGFSPSPKVAFGPPLSLGLESLDEYVDLFLTRRMDAPAIVGALSKDFFPLGVQIMDCFQVMLKGASLFTMSTKATYLVSFEEVAAGSDFSLESLPENIKAFQEIETFIVEIPKKNKIKQMDIKKLATSVKLIDDFTVLLELFSPPEGGISPLPAIRHLFDLDPETACLVRICKQRQVLENGADK